MENIGRILFSEDEILKRVRELGQQISEDYRGREIVVLCVLKGAVIFLADLLRSIDLSVQIDFVSLSSYGNGLNSSGKVGLILDMTSDIAHKDVLVVEDIVDTGLTLRFLRDILLSKRPASLKLCALLDRDGNRVRHLGIDYVGFRTLSQEFVIGYGLDYAGRYRGLPYIAELRVQEPEHQR